MSLSAICLLDNVTQSYAWGSRTALAGLMGRPVPSEKPEAEVWMGAHPRAPSRCGDQTLLARIEADPEGMLGARCAARHDGRLPFLLKLLAAASPLSIQAHPSLEQARAGFARENAAGIPLDAPERSYKDDCHKPELLCALTPFWGLNGFRPVPELLALLDEVACAEIAPEAAELRALPTRTGLRRFFRSLLHLPADRRGRLLADLLLTAQERRATRPEYHWIVRISGLYPGDPGVLCVLLLNLVRLSPGEAMFCAAGDLHAYLEGLGVELMASSDNVLRGGLTPKHVDVPELLEILTFADRPVEVLRPVGGRYRTPADEFELSRLDLTAGERWRSPAERSLEILVNVQGTARISDPSAGSLEIPPGRSVVVPASVEDYELSGPCCVYRAAVP